MNAIDLALMTGGGMTVFCGLFVLRRRRARARLDRITRHRRTTIAARWPKADRLQAALVDRPRATITAGCVVAAGIGLLSGGPVAAVLAGAYAAVGLIGVRRQLARRAADRAVAELLDTIEDAVGDLRAGIVPFATAAPYPGGADVELYTTPSPFRTPGAGGLGATVRRIWDAADRQDGQPTGRDRNAQRRRPPAGRNAAEAALAANRRHTGRGAITGRAAVGGWAAVDGRAAVGGSAGADGWPAINGRSAVDGWAAADSHGVVDGWGAADGRAATDRRPLVSGWAVADGSSTVGGWASVINGRPADDVWSANEARPAVDGRVAERGRFAGGWQMTNDQVAEHGGVADGSPTVVNGRATGDLPAADGGRAVGRYGVESGRATTGWPAAGTGQVANGWSATRTDRTASGRAASGRTASGRDASGPAASDRAASGRAANGRALGDRVAGGGVVSSGGLVGGGVGAAGSSGRARGGRARRREEAAVAVAMARLEAAHRVSEALGTPLADLLDQVEADLRAGQALRLNLAAQTSGAQTTTTLLVGLPVAGLWLGASIGVDPVGQLLHTPLGAACAIVAVALQCAGMLWTGRMVGSVVAEVR
ncbi:type II secretion system F family protein [Dactylosporangium sp. CA-152071]|uniref:type II secretion system F family protein n=1 Tax=Dactylosporangium sp. CA-152071 TaxID=3239933 RepID=UPI003D8A5AB7